MLLLGQQLVAFALNLTRTKYGMKCVTNERHKSIHAGNLQCSGIHSLHINNSFCSWRLCLWRVRLAVKYKMDHVIVELVEKWEFKFKEKKRCGRFWNLCSFHIEKEQGTLKHFFLDVKHKKRAILRIAILEALMWNEILAPQWNSFCLIQTGTCTCGFHVPVQQSLGE